MSKYNGPEGKDHAELQIGIAIAIGLALWSYAIINLAQFILNKV